MIYFDFCPDFSILFSLFAFFFSETFTRFPYRRLSPARVFCRGHCRRSTRGRHVACDVERDLSRPTGSLLFVSGTVRRPDETFETVVNRTGDVAQ